jgi:hypothetical protein
MCCISDVDSRYVFHCRTNDCVNSLLDKTFAASNLADISMFDRPEVGTIGSSIGKIGRSTKPLEKSTEGKQNLFEETLRDALRSEVQLNAAPVTRPESNYRVDKADKDKASRTENSFSSMLKNKVAESRQLADKAKKIDKPISSKEASIEAKPSDLKGVEFKRLDMKKTGLGDENNQIAQRPPTGTNEVTSEVTSDQWESMLLALSGQVPLSQQSADLSQLPLDPSRVDLSLVEIGLDQLQVQESSLVELKPVMDLNESDEPINLEVEVSKPDAPNQVNLLSALPLAQVLGSEFKPLAQHASLEDIAASLGRSGEVSLKEALGSIDESSLSTDALSMQQSAEVKPNAIDRNNAQPLLQLSEASLFQNIFNGLGSMEGRVDKIYEGQDHVQASAADVTEQLIINEISKESLVESPATVNATNSKVLQQTSNMNPSMLQANKQTNVPGLNLTWLSGQNPSQSQNSPKLEETSLVDDMVNFEVSEKELGKMSESFDLKSADITTALEQPGNASFNQDGGSFGSSEGESKQVELGSESMAKPLADARFGVELTSMMTSTSGSGDSIQGMTQVEGKKAQVSSNPTESEGLKQQLVANAKMLLTKGGGEMSMVVDTASLGKIDLALQLHNNQLDVRVVGKEANVRDMIGMEIGSLRDGLSQQGISLRTVEVASSSQGFSPNSQQGSWQQQHQTSYEDMRQYAEQSARLAKASQSSSPNLSVPVRTWTRPLIPTSALGQLGISNRISVRA